MGFAMLGVGALIALVVGLNGLRIGTFLGLLDFPDVAGGRKLHAKVTPLVGGLAVVLAALTGALFLLWWGGAALEQSMLLWFSIAVTGMFAIGLADDRFGLTAPFRLAFASALLVAAILQVPDFQIGFLLFSGQESLSLLPGFVGLGFTLLCLVGFLNAVNMADGKNGVVIGQALIWSAVLFVRLPPAYAPLIAAIGGALAVLMVFNMRGMLFLGDSGSYGISAMFGLLAILAWNTGFADMRADDMALLFALPVFDTLRLMVHRVLAGKTPFTAGRDHLHHYLYARWGWPQPLPFVLALVAIPNAGAILLPGTAPYWLLVTLAGYVGLMLAANHRSASPA